MSGQSTTFEDTMMRSHRYWQTASSLGADVTSQHIVVDMLVDHPVYFLGNLIIAKYLELTKGFKVWALISSRADLKAILTAKSFGVDGITYVRDEATQQASPAAVEIIRQLEGTSDADLRKRLLAIEINGIPVGDLIYDTYIRETRRITIRELDDELKVYLILLVNYYILYERLLSELDVGAVVLGHTVYSRFGVLARLAAKAECSVYTRFGGKGIRIQRREGLDAVMDVIFRLRPGEVDRLMKAGGQLAVETGNRTLLRRISGTENEFQYLNEESYSPDRPIPSVERFCSRMGLEASRPKGLIMMHAFSDAAHHTPRMIFDDYHEWFLHTLDVAVGQRDVDWLFKLHPYDFHYTDDREPAERIKAISEKHSHIHLVPEELNTATFPGIASFLVTVNGKAGLEFAGLGTPVLLGGNGFYSGCGFDVVPNSIDDYRNALDSAAGLYLKEDQVSRALVANDLYYRQSICNCRLIPDSSYTFWKTFDEGAFWDGYLNAMQTGTLQEDPLYMAMVNLQNSGAETLLRPE
ncbi:MAG: hypothetical protein CMP14_11540 [Rickettsiales bacterium]|nr:hypothetical protein [Rickettsiales bacterium]